MTHVVLLSCCFRACGRPSPRRSAAASPGEEGLTRWVWSVAGYLQVRTRLPRTPPAQHYIRFGSAFLNISYPGRSSPKYVTLRNPRDTISCRTSVCGRYSCMNLRVLSRTEILVFKGLRVLVFIFGWGGGGSSGTLSIVFLLTPLVLNSRCKYINNMFSR